jgi:hypothetical protein
MFETTQGRDAKRSQDDPRTGMARRMTVSSVTQEELAGNPAILGLRRQDRRLCSKIAQVGPALHAL